MRKIILASGSPRRREILEQTGFSFEVCASQKEEIITKDDPAEAVEELSRIKALDVAGQIGDRENYMIIGADTMVAVGGRNDTDDTGCSDTPDPGNAVFVHKLGKPKDEADAKQMLYMLQGRTHQVYTGVTLVYDAEGDGVREHTFHAVTDVTMYPMTEEEIDAYIKSGEPFDKAGAYAIQGLCARYIREIRGEYNTVVGLPIARIIKEIKEFGI
ncbi:MAG TPA: Maf family protein [Lachnospiraceae bacterium]|nr:Maf family protein [Lachnospiraceae bacterium]